MTIRYALVWFFDPSKAGPSEAEYQEWVDWEEAAKKAGQLVHGAGLYPAIEGKSVSVRDHKPSIDQGPPAGEAVSGYYLVEVPDEETAISLAKGIPTARYGRIEVRQVTELA